MNSLPPDNSGLPADPPAPAAISASGLDTTQIASDDLAALHAQFTFSSVTPGVALDSKVLEGWQLPAGLGKTEVQSAALAIAEVRSARMKLAPLPDRVRCQHLRLQDMHAKLHRDLAPALAQPIRRDRVAAHNLSKDELLAVNKALLAKYGGAAKVLKLEGIYREIPLEASKSVRLDESLRFCVFNLPAGTAVQRLHTGYTLIVASGDSGKTYPLLVRL